MVVNRNDHDPYKHSVRVWLFEGEEGAFTLGYACDPESVEKLCLAGAEFVKHIRAIGSLDFWEVEAKARG